MNIDIISVGKIKEKFFRDAIDEYLKRLSAFAKVNIIEIKDEKIPDNASALQCEKIKEIEGKKILSALKDGKTVALCIEGKLHSSEDIADFMLKTANSSSRKSFVIGGSLGLSDEVKAKADLKMSVGKITLPHQLMRVVLLEQIYRGFKINNNQSYHK